MVCSQRAATKDTAHTDRSELENDSNDRVLCEVRVFQSITFLIILVSLPSPFLLPLFRVWVRAYRCEFENDCVGSVFCEVRIFQPITSICESESSRVSRKAARQRAQEQTTQDKVVIIILPFDGLDDGQEVARGPAHLLIVFTTATKTSRRRSKSSCRTMLHLPSHPCSVIPPLIPPSFSTDRSMAWIMVRKLPVPLLIFSLLSITWPLVKMPRGHLLGSSS